MIRFSGCSSLFFDWLETSLWLWRRSIVMMTSWENVQLAGVASTSQSSGEDVTCPWCLCYSHRNDLENRTEKACAVPSKYNPAARLTTPTMKIKNQQCFLSIPHGPCKLFVSVEKDVPDSGASPEMMLVGLSDGTFCDCWGKQEEGRKKWRKDVCGEFIHD